jgi:predicted transcriptional regulator
MKLKTKSIPIRLDIDLRERLSRAARKMGSNRSSVIRFAIMNQLPEIEAGQITLRKEVA